MHEAAVAMSLMDLVASAAPAATVRRVLRARLELGELACLDPDTLGFAFDVASRGTLAEGCELLFDRRPARVACPACGWAGSYDPASPGCAGCGASSLELTSGRELRLVSIDVEDHDRA